MYGPADFTVRRVGNCTSAQLPFHDAPIFRLLLKIAVF